jgi:hypothetical protein
LEELYEALENFVSLHKTPKSFEELQGASGSFRELE